MSFQDASFTPRIDHAALVRAFSDFARALLDSYDIGPTLYMLADQALDVLDLDGAGLCLTVDGETLTFVTATDGDIAAIEEEQVRYDTGPCHLAFRTGEQVVVADLEAETRFDGYRQAALDRGARAVVAIPMPVEERRLGALNLYRYVPHEWTPEELDMAQLLADMASGYVLHTTELQRSRTLAVKLQHALDSRESIEQAKGMITERHHISPSEALDRLLARSRSSDTSVHSLARQVVDGSLDL